MIDAFISPPATWPPPRTADSFLDPFQASSQKDWYESARHRDWEGAIVDYLSANRGRNEMWPLINEIAAAELPECRWMLRRNKKEILYALKELIHAGRVRRYRKRWLISRDPDERQIIPLDELRRMRAFVV